MNEVIKIYYVLAIARRSLNDKLVTIVRLNRIMAPCVVGVWLGCVRVVPITGRESVTPDFTENIQADAGSHLFLEEGLFWAARWCEACRAHDLLRGEGDVKHRVTHQ
jgi:hypothetical protein